MLKDKQKNIIAEIKTLNSYSTYLSTAISKGSRKSIKNYADKLEAQARWINILISEVYDV